MSASVPSKLVLLSDLPNTPLGDKVRFLGCIETYDVSKGQLVLKHEYPSRKQLIYATVNVDHVRESLLHTATQVGTWVNVVGYIQEHKKDEKRFHVQAIMLWEAGPLKIDAYEKAFQARKDTGTTG